MGGEVRDWINDDEDGGERMGLAAGAGGEAPMALETEREDGRDEVQLR